MEEQDYTRRSQRPKSVDYVKGEHFYTITIVYHCDCRLFGHAISQRA